MSEPRTIEELLHEAKTRAQVAESMVFTLATEAACYLMAKTDDNEIALRAAINDGKTLLKTDARPVLLARVEAAEKKQHELASKLDAEQMTTQRFVDHTIYYRNLAIKLGAKPSQMEDKYDRSLCERGPAALDERAYKTSPSFSEEVAEHEEYWGAMEQAQSERDAALASASEAQKRLATVEAHAEQVARVYEQQQASIATMCQEERTLAASEARAKAVEECAAPVEKILAAHDADSPRCREMGACECFGYGTLERIIAALRALAPAAQERGKKEGQ